MADKHHGAKQTRKKQRDLVKLQQEALLMNITDNTENVDFSRAVARNVDVYKIAERETITQNGRIEVVEATLDKDSSKRKDYDRFVEQNRQFLDLSDFIEE